CPTTTGTPSGPVGDTTPPVISNVKTRQDGKGGVDVSATITDNIAVASAALWWNGQEFAMTLTGTNRYEARINPAETNGQLRDYSIIAVDTSGNVVVWHSSKAARISYTNSIAMKNKGGALEPVNTALGSFYTQH